MRYLILFLIIFTIIGCEEEKTDDNRGKLGYSCINKECNKELICDSNNICIKDPCNEKNCNNGICKIENFSAICVCKEGYNGKNCENEIKDSCFPSPCKNNGVCNPKGEGYICNCKEGYDGKNCENKIKDSCHPNRCLNQGVCHLNGTDYNCECKPGFNGKNCEIEPINCESNPCQHSGICKDKEEGYECECKPEYFGKNCEKDHCTPDPCLNGGTCGFDADSYTCYCRPGYSGVNCEIEVEDACHPNPCENGALCALNNSSYKCQCKPGFIGQNCENEQTDCDPNPCVMGSCTISNGRYKCDCQTGYTGKNCDEELDNCSPNPCPANRLCMSEGNSYECVCKVGYEFYGDECKKQPIYFQWGSVKTDKAISFDIDNENNIYIIGYTNGSLSGDNLGDYDIFLTKIDNLGEKIWTKQLGTSEKDLGYAIKIDGENIYITGKTEGAIVASSGKFDAFLIKFNKDGDEIWKKQFGTSEKDRAAALAINNGNIYVTGRTGGVLGVNNLGDYDIFLTKFSNDGNIVWSKQWGGLLEDYSKKVEVFNNNIYVVGTTYSDLDGINLGETDIFVTKLTIDGEIIWNKQWGTSGGERGNSLSLDSNGNIYTLGHTEGNINGNNLGKNDIFLSKLDNNGSLLWSKQWGTSNRDLAFDLFTINDQIITLGSTEGNLATLTNQAEEMDITLSKFSSNGDNLWNKQWGADEIDIPKDLLIKDNKIYIVGYTTSSLNWIENLGEYDIFMIKLDH